MHILLGFNYILHVISVNLYKSDYPVRIRLHKNIIDYCRFQKSTYTYNIIIVYNFLGTRRGIYNNIYYIIRYMYFKCTHFNILRLKFSVKLNDYIL